MTVLSKITRNKIIIYTLSFIIPVVMMVIVYAKIGQWPFGNKSLIVHLDMIDQYTNYFQYMRESFFNANDFVYTFSKVIGGDMIGLIAYYLASPFNLLFVIFKENNQAKILLIITLLKIGFSGLCFCIFLSYKKALIYNIIFSTAYALMGYNIVYQQNIMWIDGIILVPIVLLGVERLIEKNKLLLYIFSLFVAIITNYYIGYMICIFSFLYFTYKMILSYNKIEFYIKRRHIINNILNFIFCSILAVGASSFLLIPTIKSLSGGKGPDIKALIDTSGQLGFFELISKLFTGAFIWRQVFDGGPNVFCSLPIVILAILFFMNVNVDKKTKYTSVLFLAILFFSFKIKIIDNIWHGFNPPTGYPYRYSFAFSFLIIYFAYICFVNLKNGTIPNHVIKCFALFFIISEIITVINYAYLSSSMINWSILVVGLTLVFIFILIKNSKYRKFSYFIICFICFLDIIVNGYKTLNEYNFSDIYELDSYVRENSSIINMINDSDPEFYRMERNFARTVNDPMLLGYNGMTHNSSCEKYFVKSFVSDLGQKDRGLYVLYADGNTIAFDSFFGIKYLLSKHVPNNYYLPLYSDKGVTAYKNPYALPIAFWSGNKIMEFKGKGDNPFEYQNNIFSSIADIESNPILKRCESVTINTSNLVYDEADKSYTLINKGKVCYIEYKVNLQGPNPIYANFYADIPGGELYVNDVKVKPIYVDNFEFKKGGVIQLLNGLQNGQATVKIIFNTQGMSSVNKFKIERADFYYQDMKNFDDYFNKIQENNCTLSKITSSHLLGEVDIQNDNGYILFTIPYEKAWKIKVDGVQIDSKMVFETLMAVPIEKGKHIIDIMYIPSGAYLGIFISAISFVVIILFLYWRSVRTNTQR